MATTFTTFAFSTAPPTGSMVVVCGVLYVPDGYTLSAVSVTDSAGNTWTTDIAASVTGWDDAGITRVCAIAHAAIGSHTTPFVVTMEASTSE